MYFFTPLCFCLNLKEDSRMLKEIRLIFFWYFYVIRKFNFGINFCNWSKLSLCLDGFIIVKHMRYINSSSFFNDLIMVFWRMRSNGFWGNYWDFCTKIDTFNILISPLMLDHKFAIGEIFWRKNSTHNFSIWRNCLKLSTKMRK